MAGVDLAIDSSRADSAIRTGTEWYSHELLKAMAALKDRPQLTLYHRSDSGDWPSGVGINHRVVRMPRLWTHVGLSWRMLRDRPKALFVPSHVIPLAHPRVSVVTVHDLGYLREPEAHTWRSRLMLDRTTRWNARVATQIIAVSAATRDDLVQHYGVSPAKIAVVHSAINHDRFRPHDPSATLADAGIRQPYLLFLSTVQPRKNLVRIVEAFERLSADGMRLVVAGRSGWLSEDVEQRLRASPKRERIDRIGYVDDDLVPALYAGASAFIHPALYEGFGLGILEAMASGCPVVTSDRSSMPEVAGDAAVLVDPTNVDSILQGIETALNPSQRTSLIERGLQRAAQFTWERTARQTLAVIEEARRVRG